MRFIWFDRAHCTHAHAYTQESWLLARARMARYLAKKWVYRLRAQVLTKIYIRLTPRSTWPHRKEANECNQWAGRDGRWYCWDGYLNLDVERVCRPLAATDIILNSWFMWMRFVWKSLTASDARTVIRRRSTFFASYSSTQTHCKCSLEIHRNAKVSFSILFAYFNAHTHSHRLIARCMHEP